MQVLLLTLCALASLAARAVAIHCYACESVYEPNCGEDFEVENHFKWDCARIQPPRYLENELDDQNSTACMKRIFKENGVQKIVRSCFFGDVNNTDIGCRPDPILEGVEELSCHVCDDVNYCNHGAMSQQTNVWPVYVGMSGFIFMAKLLNTY